jgi:hypothetical protein
MARGLKRPEGAKTLRDPRGLSLSSAIFEFELRKFSQHHVNSNSL